VRIGVLEDRIAKLEEALLALLKEKGEIAEKEKEQPQPPTPNGPELSDEEKILPENWARRFQWRQKNPAKEGEDYIEINSPNQQAENNGKSWFALVHDEDAKGTPERILIRNQKIQVHLRGTPGLETFEEVRLNLNSIEISSPFSPLFHHIESVKKEIEADPTSTPIDKADSM
jgi:hypothetical protein